MQPPTLMFCIAGVDTEKLRMSIANQSRTYLTDFIPAEYFGQNNQSIVVGLRERVAGVDARALAVCRWARSKRAARSTTFTPI
ncbi:MAG: hypothetical protein ABIR24_02965 [Verrucomicrobiota bacterium]